VAETIKKVSSIQGEIPLPNKVEVMASCDHLGDEVKKEGLIWKKGTISFIIWNRKKEFSGELKNIRGFTTKSNL